MSEAARWRLPPLRQGHAASPDLIDRRARAAGTLTGDEPVVDRVIGGVRCLILNDAAAERTILYFHGGGYRMSSPAAYVDYAGRIAEAAGARLVMPFYRLAPEHPFPAALHDAAAVYRALAEAGPVVIGGDSAGGGLSASLCVAAHAAGSSPAGAILQSPMLDFTAADECYDRNAGRDALFSRAAVLDCANLYLQGFPADDPLVAPLRADPALFPSTLVLAGGAEVLLGEAIAFARRLALADRPVTLHVSAGMGHVWPLMAPARAEAAEAIAAMAAFVRARF